MQTIKDSQLKIIRFLPKKLHIVYDLYVQTQLKSTGQRILPPFGDIPSPRNGQQLLRPVLHQGLHRCGDLSVQHQPVWTRPIVP